MSITTHLVLHIYPIKFIPKTYNQPDISFHYHYQLDAKLYLKPFAKLPFTRCNATLTYLKQYPLFEIPSYHFPFNPNIPLISTF